MVFNIIYASHLIFIINNVYVSFVHPEGTTFTVPHPIRIFFRRDISRCLPGCKDIFIIIGKMELTKLTR